MRPQFAQWKKSARGFLGSISFFSKKELQEEMVYLPSVQFSHSVVSDSLRPHELQHARPPCPSPSPRVHSDKSIESMMPSSHLILGRPLLLLPPIPPSIKVFSNESTLRMRWPKYWSFSFSIIPSKEIPGLISFRMEQNKVHTLIKNTVLLKKC